MGQLSISEENCINFLVGRCAREDELPIQYPFSLSSTVIILYLERRCDLLTYSISQGPLHSHVIMWLYLGQWEVNREGSVMSWQAAAKPFFLPAWLWQLEVQWPSFFWLVLKMVEEKRQRTLVPRAHRKSTCLPSVALFQAFFIGEERLSRLRCYQQCTIPNWWSNVTGQAPGTGLWESGAEMATWHCQVPISPSQRSLWPSLCSEQGLAVSGDNVTLVAKRTLFGVWTSLGWKPALPPTICGLGKF